MNCYGVAIDTRRPELYAEAESFFKAVPNVGEVKGTGSSFEGVSDVLEIVFSVREIGYCFGYTVKRTSGGNVCVDLYGADLNGQFCALYLFLEKIGFYFDILKPQIPERIDMSVLQDGCVTIEPDVENRGTRFHINFPMDISSYTLNEAKEYVRNLARLKHNCVAFHSYPSQFYAYTKGGKRYEAGKYFYGEVQNIFNIASIQNVVDNTSYYCIPEHEYAFNDEQANGRLAVFWLNEVMKECKKYGLYVVFSFEPRDQSESEVLKTLEELRQCYPSVDCFELMTQECGCGWSAESAWSVEKLRESVAEWYGQAFLEEIAPLLKEGLSQLPLTLRELKLCCDSALEANRSGIRTRVGYYTTCPVTVQICTCYAEKLKTLEFSALPSHSANYVADMWKQTEISEELSKRLTIYSWVEFDGQMFELENSCTGIFSLVDAQKKRFGKSSAILFNHWRTAENALVIKYVSAVCLDASLTPNRFYESFCEQFGVSRKEDFVKSLTLIEEADRITRDRLPNIGFCAVYCWYNQDETYPGYIKYYEPEVIASVTERFAAALELLKSCGSKNVRYERWRRLMLNRLRASIVHLDGIRTLCPITELIKREGYDKQRVLELCNRALAYAKEYMLIVGEEIQDRGCQGTIVSYYKTVCHYIYMLRHRYGGAEMPEVYEKRITDAPPSPLIYGED